MSKKIHIKGNSKDSHCFCGNTMSRNIYTAVSYLLEKDHGNLHESRICKECLEWFPIYWLGNSDRVNRAISFWRQLNRRQQNTTTVVSDIVKTREKLLGSPIKGFGNTL